MDWLDAGAFSFFNQWATKDVLESNSLDVLSAHWQIVLSLGLNTKDINMLIKLEKDKLGLI